MRRFMGITKNSHGVYVARKTVPKRLREAVAQVLQRDKPRVSFLQRSLRTKNLQEANILAKPVLVEFDQILARAESRLADRPVVAELDDRRIKEIAEYHYASILEEDEDLRRDGSGSQQVYLNVAEDLAKREKVVRLGYPLEEPREFGLADRELDKMKNSVDWALGASAEALTRGDIAYVADELDELLDNFCINLDKRSAAFRRLGMAVLREQVKAFRAIEQRNKGEVIETPQVLDPDANAPRAVGGLREAFEGWKKQKKRSPNTLIEYGKAIDRFAELHGDLPVAKITKRHVREFREALQDMPLKRTGNLRKAALPELQKWGKENPDVPKLAAGTINKLLGGCQAVAVWARDNGIIPDEMPWSDPFARMRLEEDEPSRESWQVSELRVLFSSSVYSHSDRPQGGRGEAAFWLPLLGLFTGARLGELAPLRTSDIVQDEETRIVSIKIVDKEAQGKRLKTKSSRRTVPVHPELKRLGFLQYVEDRRKAEGDSATLFPLLTVGPRGGLAESWSKWFGRYIRGIGITNTDRVFHSLRHTFKDALRKAGVSEDINDALLGQAGGGVGRGYGAKDMERRFGLERLSETVEKVRYVGLDLSPLYPLAPKKKG